MAERADDPKNPVPTYTERDGCLEVLFPATGSAGVIHRIAREVVQVCLDRKPSCLLIDLTGIHGTFSTLERFELGRIAAELASHVGRVATVARPELIDPQKFGVQVAKNRGLTTDIFSDREAALAWLKES